jgi:anhydro-N-acetylmuramic acid kinase
LTGLALIGANAGMTERKRFRALGLMSGTSLDGIDAALIETDGARILATGAAATVAYDDDLREALRAILGSEKQDTRTAEVERALTLAHADAVRRLLDAAGLAPAEIDIVGFHGHTVLHRPERRLTWQIGDGALLAAECGIDVVCDFRSNDVAAGGEGAPLAPTLHAALAEDMEKPLCVLNLGGVGNITWIGEGGAVLAFDTGPANALIDEWVQQHTGARCDEGGRIAASGNVDEAALAALVDNPYFERRPPKSLDRLDFGRDAVAGFDLADGAATLTAFTVLCVGLAMRHLPELPSRVLVTGGGRQNPTLMEGLAALLPAPVAPVEDAGWNGDALEAQAFAFMAVRSRLGLPITWPGTTGIAAPMTGGRLFRAVG